MKTTSDTEKAADKKLSTLIASLNPLEAENLRDVPVEEITHDSRRASAGSLFVALRGTETDGHRYISDAVQNGASAVLCEELPETSQDIPIVQTENTRTALSAVCDAYFDHPSRDLKVTGVTGTDGKTSTTVLLDHILRNAGYKPGRTGTLAHKLGKRTLESEMTTPDPFAMHRMLNEMQSGGLTHACMEVSSHSLSLHKTDHVDFDVGVLTDITEDHLDFHGSRENYIRAKQRLFEALPEEGVAVLNADSEVCDRFQQATSANVLTYGIDTLADIRGRILKQTPQGTRMVFQTPLWGRVLQTPLIGEYNCHNILAAATAAFALGCEAGEIAGALENFTGVPGRLEKVNAGSPDMPGVCVDYAHTPDALDKVLSALRPLVEDKLVCVFGCGGDREKEKRPAMGRIATEKADYSVITSDNSRSEDTNDIIDDILEGVSAPSHRWRVEPDRRAAIRLGVSAAKNPGSMVVVCGKGAESVLDQGHRKIPFDDRDVAAKVLRSMSRREKRA